MELQQRVAAALRAQADQVGSWTRDLDSVRRRAHRQSMRRTAVVVTAVVTIGIAGVSALDARRDDRSSPPADDTDNGRAVLTIPKSRPEQVVATPLVRSIVDPGSQLVASASTTDAAYAGAAEIELPFTVTESSWWEASCGGAPDDWLVVILDTDQYVDAGRCNGEVLDKSKEPPEPGSQVLRIFTTDEDPTAFVRCFRIGTGQRCAAVGEPSPASVRGAALDLRVFQEDPGPVAATMFGDKVHARAEWNGATYSLTTVAAAASGAARLAFQVDAAPTPSIVQATTEPTRKGSRCMATVRPGQWERCRPTVELLIDGKPARDQYEGPFRIGLGGSDELRPGGAHVVTLRVTQGDPRNIDLGILIYQQDP